MCSTNTRAFVALLRIALRGLGGVDEDEVVVGLDGLPRVVRGVEGGPRGRAGRYSPLKSMVKSSERMR